MDTQPITAETDADEAVRAAVQKGIASADAGHVMPYAEVRKWLASWGTQDEQPVPRRK